MPPVGFLVRELERPGDRVEGFESEQVLHGVLRDGDDAEPFGQVHVIAAGAGDAEDEQPEGPEESKDPLVPLAEDFAEGDHIFA